METPPSSDFHSEIFHSTNFVCFREIKSEFDRECKWDPNSILAPKLAYLFIVYGVVLMDGRLESRIPLRFMHLIDNLESFKAFPGGWAAYENLVSRIYQAKKVISSLDNGTKDRKCEAPRFVDVLQVWAFEVTPAIANYCVIKIDPAICHPVRILIWSADKKSSYHELYEFFLPSSAYNPVNLELSLAFLSFRCSK